MSINFNNIRNKFKKTVSFHNPQICNDVKYFCIGFNKTGTTSVEKAFLDLGFQLGSQDKGTSLFQAWVDRDFNEICKFAKSADVFQDIPFSLPYTFIALEQYFPNAKFILTIRDDENEWYDSLVRFHIKLWGKEGQTKLTREDLENATPYHYSRLYFVQKIYQTEDYDLYNKNILTKVYLDHNSSVEYYFKDKPEKLLILNLQEDRAYHKFVDFLGVTTEMDDFPKLNASK